MLHCESLLWLLQQGISKYLVFTEFIACYERETKRETEREREKEREREREREREKERERERKREEERERENKLRRVRVV